MARVDLVDRYNDMLRTASGLLRPLLRQSTAALHPVAAEEFSAPFDGCEADLVTCARAFHRMDRPAAPPVADRVTTPEAAVAVMGDGSLWTHEAEWTSEIAKGADAPAILGEASPAYLTHVQTRHGDNPADRLWEFTVHAFGDQGPVLASQVAATVRAWDRDVRDGDGPALTVHPAGTPDHRLPAGDVVDKKHARLVFQWPGRDAVLPAPVERMGAVPPGLEGT
ncbi:hypothetical protein [Streptomyces sp. NPDC057557]|uniref:hypothetical protein n=1 Tax=Streptomyces sp. NPDC057557 TaxID=3346167 RepID=UPI00369738B8